MVRKRKPGTEAEAPLPSEELDAEVTDPDLAESPPTLSEETTAPETPVDAAAEQSFAELHDRYLRLAADFENHKKRTAREWQTRVQLANAELLLELLDIADNFQRAIDADHEQSTYADGVRLIYEQVQALLERRGVKKMVTVGKAFDPQRHDALLHVPSEEYADGLVCQEIRSGYEHHDRVLRAAQVAVSSGPPEETPENVDHDGREAGPAES